MSSFTQEQLTALEKAIADGALKVKYADKEITYRSLQEMISLRELMKQELNTSTDTRRGHRSVGCYGSGL